MKKTKENGNVRTKENVRSKNEVKNNATSNERSVQIEATIVQDRVQCRWRER